MNPILRYISPLHEKNRWLLRVICLIILLSLIAAGLWPLNFRAKNKVSWLEYRNGVNFYGQGLIVGSEIRGKGQNSPFPGKSITLEIWVRPLLETSNLPHILTLYDGKSPDLFALGQWKSHLVIRSRMEEPIARTRDKPYREIGLQNGLLKNRDTFITMASGTGGTAVYVNGKRVQSHSNYNMLAALTETPLRFILGNSSTGESFWSGNIMGFAVYNRVLTPAQVFTSYHAWTGQTLPLAAADEGCLGMYPFNERQGSSIHNVTDVTDALVIPEIFKPLQRKTLSPMRQGLRWSFSYVQDIMINVIGFIPFGFFFYALLLKTACRRRRLTSSATHKLFPLSGEKGHDNKQPALLPENPGLWTECLTGAAVVIFGTGISFAIEITQAYLPTRDSSLTDVVMNAAGALLGVASYQMYMKIFRQPNNEFHRSSHR